MHLWKEVKSSFFLDVWNSGDLRNSWFKQTESHGSVESWERLCDTPKTFEWKCFLRTLLMKENPSWAQVLPMCRYGQLLFLICVGSRPMICKSWKTCIDAGERVSQGDGSTEGRQRAGPQMGGRSHLVGGVERCPRSAGSQGWKEEPSSVGWIKRANELVGNYSNWQKGRSRKWYGDSKYLTVSQKVRPFLTVFAPSFAATLLIHSAEKCNSGSWKLIIGK